MKYSATKNEYFIPTIARNLFRGGEGRGGTRFLGLQSILCIVFSFVYDNIFSIVIHLNKLI